MREAGMHIGQSYRWMQRNYLNLIQNGVQVLRVPLGSPKGRLVFEMRSLESYMQACQLKIEILHSEDEDRA